MRQSQQNKNRMRNRGRKQSNPLSRNYESNGPDVKIRGNAAHIAEKYTSLARDAQAAGDRVIAENYLQHAEHYNRLIAAANAQKEAARAENQPQPEVQEGQEQDAANDDNTQTEEVAAEAETKRNRRERRPRKPRNEDAAEKAEASSKDAGKEADASSNGSSSNGAGEETPRRRSRKRDDDAVVAEGVSEDAASLPESILGGAA